MLTPPMEFSGASLMWVLRHSTEEQCQKNKHAMQDLYRQIYLHTYLRICHHKKNILYIPVGCVSDTHTV